MKSNPDLSLFLRILTSLIAAFFLSSTSSAEAMEVEDTEIPDSVSYLLPIDFSAGSPLKSECFSESTDDEGNLIRMYEDSTIKVVVSEQRWFVPNGRDNKGTRIWIADIVISDTSQLRTASMDDQHDFSNNKKVGNVANAAEKMNAVVAINGDSWGANERAEKDNYGVVYRQGRLFSIRLDNTGKKMMDLLLIDMDGNFHGIHAAKEGDLDNPSVFEGNNILDIFAFGPILVENGKAVTDFQGTDSGRENRGGTWMKMLSDETAQRVAICQVGPLHYYLVASEKYYENRGLTLPEFAECLASLGVQFAYNLDGGQSSVLYYPGVGKLNVPKLDNRNVWDFIYFASAEQE